ncbi:MAG: AEC family transporter [Cohaesibacter sp.]|jgi:predicted permease|nr:AEC family transporter [Cohaesibacter sp.]
MVDIFSLVFPIFGLIAVGYVLVTSGILPLASGNALSKFVFTLPIPLLIFKALATSDPSAQSPWLLWLTYFGSVFVIWSLGMISVQLFFGRRGSVLVVAGISAAFSNLVLLGIPIVSGVYGDKGLVPLLLLLSIHLPIMMLTSSVLVEYYGTEGEDPKAKRSWGAMIKRVALGLIQNPIIIGILSGGLWGIMGWPIPHLAGLVIDKIVPTAVPLALIAMGMGLKQYGLRGHIAPGFVLALLKTMAFPALLYVLVFWVMPMDPLWAGALVLGAASPTGVNAYLLADHFKVGHGLAANSITLSVLLGLITLPFWLTVVT